MILGHFKGDDAEDGPKETVQKAGIQRDPSSISRSA